MDNRIAEALQTIGSIIESDLNTDDCNEVITQLVNMRDFAYSVKWGKKFRLDGKIDLATNQEQEADKIYENLPQEIKW